MASVSQTRDAIETWYRTNRRNLPWRRTRDPYAIWISEIMLQQTRVDTVVPYFERFIARWPDVDALSRADPDDIRAAWSGLGYYRRAKLMLKAAAAVAAEGGRLPTTFDGLKGLPGLGRYTAGAIASIAYDARVPAVDGNVMRVLARRLGLEGDVTKGDNNRAIWAYAAELAESDAPGDLNQGLIEIGALLCRPRNPDCQACPLAGGCVARASGRTEHIPPPRKKPKRARVELTALVCIHEGCVLLEKQGPNGLFADFWLTPTLEGTLEPPALADEAQRKYGWDVDASETRGDFRHVLTHRDLDTLVVRLTGTTPPSADMEWVDFGALPTRALPSLATRILALGLESEGLTIAPSRRFHG